MVSPMGQRPIRRPGADGGTRTLTGLPPRDFKSLASTIPPRPRAAVLASRLRAAKPDPARRSRAGAAKQTSVVQRVAPDAVPVLAGRIGDTAVGLEELVGYLEDGQHQA